MPAEAALDPAHPSAIAFVVVAKQVQQAVQRQDAPLGELRVSGLACLAARHAAGDHDISETRTRGS